MRKRQHSSARLRRRAGSVALVLSLIPLSHLPALQLLVSKRITGLPVVDGDDRVVSVAN